MTVLRRNAAFWAFPQRSRFGLPIRAALRAGRWRYRKIAPLEGRSGVSDAEQFPGRSAFCANFLQWLPRKNPNRKRLRALTRFSKKRTSVPPKGSRLHSPRIRPSFPEREGAKFRKRDTLVRRLRSAAAREAQAGELDPEAGRFSPPSKEPFIVGLPQFESLTPPGSDVSFAPFLDAHIAQGDVSSGKKILA